MGDPAPNPSNASVSKQGVSKQDAANQDAASESSIQQAYAALERLYSEGRWSDARAAGESLLAALTAFAFAANGNQDPGAGAQWRARVLLMLGHTQLYGLADPAAASSHYREALGQEPEPEPLLREIAEAGLAQCETMGRDRAAGAPSAPTSAAISAATSAMATADAIRTADATPWLDPAEEAPPELPLEHLPPEMQPEGSVFGGFLDSVQPVQIAKTPEKDLLLPPMHGEADPEDQTELAQGLLRVVIRAN